MNKKKLLKLFSDHIKNEVAYYANKTICAEAVLTVLSKEYKVTKKEEKQFLVDCELESHEW